MEGTGTHFEITDSTYLNITLDSSEEIKVVLQSAPEMVTMYIEPASDATSTTITISGFEPNTTYFKYEDDYHNMVELTTDGTGSYTYTQDLSKEHFVFFQTSPSTFFIKDDVNGGHCGLIGDWDWDSKTCTMTSDLDDPIEKTIQIDDSGITLDGDGYTLTSSASSKGVYSSGTTGVTIKNLEVENSLAGISVFDCSNCTITNNTISNSTTGIQILSSEINIVTGNTTVSNGVGVYLILSNNTLIKNNVSASNFNGIFIFESNDNTIVNNNFMNNTEQASVLNSTGNVFNLASPDGGNYWSDYETVVGVCNDAEPDGFCDVPYPIPGTAITYDNLPLVEPFTDTTPPVITIYTPQLYGLYEVGMILDFEAVDSESGVVPESVIGTLTNTEGVAKIVESGDLVTDPGVYSLVVTAEDYAGNSASQTVQQFVVYDPSGGFATGGGWFYPDAKESTLSPEGKANFGFVAKYQKGKATGNLEFQYQDAAVNLKSTAIEWIVISGTSAQFQGTGTIDGENYTFRVQAKDNGEPGTGTDEFNIRIWNSEGELVHKAKNILSGGNIVIHSKKK